MGSNYLFKFSQLTAQENAEGGSRTLLNKKIFPVISGMSLYKLVLNPKGIREPHWHVRGDEMGYCLQGKVLITMYDTNDTKVTFLVQAGEVYFIPSGALHHVENVGAESAELILCFSNEDVEDFSLSTTLNMFSNAVLGNTWNVDEKKFELFHRSNQPVFAGLRKSSVSVPDDAHYETPYRYSLEESQPLLTSDGGSAKMARKNVWPIVREQALYSLTLTGTGMREPHWHPETAELGYVNQGKGRMSILHPSGKIETYEMEKGDVYFIPKAYPHHIENLQTEKLHLLIFFNQPMPKDIGFTGSVRSFSNEVLAATTKNQPDFFNQLTKYYKDLFIVDKINSIDKA